MKTKSNWRWAVVVVVGGLGVVSACSSDDDDSPTSNGTAGKSNTAGSSGSGGGPKAGAPGKGDGGGGAGPGTDGGAGGVKPGGGGAGGSPDCASFKNAADCEAHDCSARTGTLSALLEAEGGAGGAAGGGGTSAGGALGDACSSTEDFFRSCEEAVGGASMGSRCDASCTRCLEGDWTEESAEFPRRDCVFSCLDGVAVREQ